MEAKKQKKIGNLKFQRAPQPKHDDQGFKTNEKDEQPRILLKAKGKSDDQSNAPVITIVTKIGSICKHEQNAQSTKNRSNLDVQSTLDASNMPKSVSLVGAQDVLNVQALDFLLENNPDFFVIGAIGSQFTGKSTILNLLATASDDKKVFPCKEYFPVTDIFASLNTIGEDIRMLITKDRVILLESSPVLTNRGEKDFILSELDDIKRIILLLSTCHVLIVMQEEYLNINFVRLLLCAEMMMQKHKTCLSPKIVFVKNKCDRFSFPDTGKTAQESVYKELFRHSKLDIYNNMYETQQINMVYFPNLTDSSLCADERARNAYVHKFRQQIFMTPKQNTTTTVQDGLNEKMWFQIITNVLEGNNNNYFLRRYEVLKEKYNLHNHVNVVDNFGKEKMFLNFVET